MGVCAKQFVSFFFVGSLFISTLAPINTLGASQAQIEDQNLLISFEDVKPEEWFYDDVVYVVDEGIMQGNAPNLFSPNAYTTRAQAVLALHRLCGMPEVINEPRLNDVPDNSMYAEAIDWACTYNIASEILTNQFAPDAFLNQKDFINILYHYADYRYYDLSGNEDCSDILDKFNITEEEEKAFNWAIDHEIVEKTGNQKIQPDAYVTRAQMAAAISDFVKQKFLRKEAISEGIDLIYPSSYQKTICPKRDFYVIGEFLDGVSIPQDAVCDVKFISNETGELLRQVYSTQKDFKEGMYVDYQGFEYDGDRETLRNACMPDLMYDGKDLNTFKDTWRKCYFNDDVFTAIVYGGTYLQDVNQYDQNGKELKEFPEGNYTLNITVENAFGTKKYAGYEDRITIG